MYYPIIPPPAKHKRNVHPAMKANDASPPRPPAQAVPSPPKVGSIYSAHQLPSPSHRNAVLPPEPPSSPPAHHAAHASPTYRTASLSYTDRSRKQDGTHLRPFPRLRGWCLYLVHAGVTASPTRYHLRHPKRNKFKRRCLLTTPNRCSIDRKKKAQCTNQNPDTLPLHLPTPAPIPSKHSFPPSQIQLCGLPLT